MLTVPVQNKYEDSVFGFTIHPVLATVYYEYAVRRAKSDHAEFEIPIILGCVIAHELGHLPLVERTLRRRNYAAAVGTSSCPAAYDGDSAFHHRTVDAHASPGANANECAVGQPEGAPQENG